MPARPLYTDTKKTAFMLEGEVYERIDKEANRLGVTPSRYMSLVMQAAMESKGNTIQPRLHLHPERSREELRTLAKKKPGRPLGSMLVIKYARLATA